MKYYLNLDRKEAYRVIKRIVATTNNIASREARSTEISSFDEATRLMYMAMDKDEKGDQWGIRVSCLNDSLEGRKIIEYAGTWTGRRRIQFNFVNNDNVLLMVKTGTGKRSTFFDNVLFKNIEENGGVATSSFNWLIPLED